MVQVRIEVLGDLTAKIDGAEVALPAGKARQILALLAIHANQVVTVGTLMAEIWGDEPPRSATTTLQTYIVQLRRCLARADESRPGPAGRKILVTGHGGYRLAIDQSDVDVHAFDTLVALGQTAIHADDLYTGSGLIGEAIQLWRGPALADVRKGAQLGIEAVRLTEARLSAVEIRIAADLRLGRHAQVVGELTTLTARYPTHETLHAKLMLALHRLGRRDEAVSVFHRLRGALADELGLEPTRSVCWLYWTVLNGTSRHRHRHPSAPDVLEPSVVR